MKRVFAGFAFAATFPLCACTEGSGSPHYTVSTQVSETVEAKGLECDCTPKEEEIVASIGGGVGSIIVQPTPKYASYEAEVWVLCRDGVPGWEDTEANCVCNADADEDGDGLAYCDDCDDEGGKCLHSAILMIPDGLGFQQIIAARMYLHGADYQEHPFEFEQLESRGQVATFSANSDITDSAASATAYATGVKVNNGAISFNGSDLRTVLELHKAAGKSTGLVSIYDSVLGATPAAFGAHTASRGDTLGIAEDLCRDSQPNVLFGGSLSALTLNTLLGVEGECVSPYSQPVVDEAGLLALRPQRGAHFLASFPDALVTNMVTTPSLAQRTEKALELLEGDPEGLFLVVEHAETDKYGHQNNLPGVIQAVIEFNEAVIIARKWIAEHSDSLLVIVPDHETGGLGVTEMDPQVGVIPEHRYTTSGHSSAYVPIFAEGLGAEKVERLLDNTEIYWLLRRGTVGPLDKQTLK